MADRSFSPGHKPIPPGACHEPAHIDSSILGANSVSRALSTKVVEKLKGEIPDLTIVRRDLAETPVPHLSGATLAAAQSREGDHEPAVRADLAISGAVLEEFLDADVVVIGVAFYNFTIPSQLKAWIDRILVAGQTFRYGADGRPEGLAGGKRAILAVARGGFYGPGAPTEAFEHADTRKAICAPRSASSASPAPRW